MIRSLFRTQPLDRIRNEDDGEPGLRRVLGRAGLIGIGLGTMLGGIFTTIGAGTKEAGPAVILAFVLSGLACTFVAFCYAELASMVPVAGSAYTYAYATLGEVIAWIIGWDLILEYGISAAPVASSWSAYVQSLLASLGVHLPAWAQTAHLGTTLANTQVDLIAALIILAISALLAIGIRESSVTNTALVAFQVIALLVLVAAAWSFVRGATLVPFAPTGASGIVTGAALVFFAYIGFDTVTVASEEARDPVRDLPVGIIGSLVIGMLLYLAIAYVTAGTVPWKTINEGAGLADVVTHAGNNRLLMLLVTLGAIAGTTTVILTSLLGQIRIFYVMSRDRLLPAAVAQVDPRTRTPVRTTLITGIVVAILAAIVPLADLLALVNIGTLSAFMIVCAGVVVLRVRKPEVPRPYRAPLGPLVGVLGFALCAYLMFGGLSGLTWLRFIVWFLAGMAIYLAYGYRNSLLRNREVTIPEQTPGISSQSP